MPRPIPQNAEPINADSFLDIVASVVSIMIIMVVMVGMRIKNAPVKVAIPASPAAKELDKTLAEEQSLRGDVGKMVAETNGLRRQTAIRGLHRDALATVAAAAEHEIQSRRRELDGARQAEFDLAQKLSEAKARLERLAYERQAAESTPGEQVVVESYPTPISREVDGPEAHLMVAHGRVVFVPMESLIEQLKAQVRRQSYKLADQPELTDTLGPVEGFRLRYTLERYDVAPDGPRGTGHGGSYVRLQRFSLIPTSEELGEPVRLALDQGSDFRRTLSKILPGRTTITIWVYPDGFDAFRLIRKELYRQGYSIAARPLPPGEPIGGSPDGTKSAAQ